VDWTSFVYDPAVWGPPEDTSHEEGLAEAIEASGDRVHFCDLTDAVNNTDGVIFVAVQTPHEPRFEGVTPLPDDRADFDYTFLIDAVTRVVKVADALEKDITLAVISTVLPGTMEREIVPLLSRAGAVGLQPVVHRDGDDGQGLPGSRVRAVGR
jgi:UDP-N-acetyl-D-mannosaminuronate dehydrogenase